MTAAPQRTTRPLLAEIAAACARTALDVDQGRTTPQPAIEALRVEGYVDTLVRGDAAAGLRAAVALVEQLAGACPSTAWNFAIFLTHRGSAEAFPTAAKELMGIAGPRPLSPLIATALVTRHRAVVDEHGVHIDGEWEFISGARYADWVWLATREPSDEGGELEIDLSQLLFGEGEGNGEEESIAETGPRTVDALAKAIKAIGRYDGVKASFLPPDADEASQEELGEDAGPEGVARKERDVFKDPELRLSGSVRIPVFIE